jgi:hypothetical protein
MGILLIKRKFLAIGEKPHGNPLGRVIVDPSHAALEGVQGGGDGMEKRERSAAWFAGALAAASLIACSPHKTEAPVTPPRAETAIVPGGETTVVPARTGSQSSGVLGSSTVIGAPAPGQPGIALAH